MRGGANVDAGCEIEGGELHEHVSVKRRVAKGGEFLNAAYCGPVPTRARRSIILLSLDSRHDFGVLQLWERHRGAKPVGVQCK